MNPDHNPVRSRSWTRRPAGGSTASSSAAPAPRRRASRARPSRSTGGACSLTSRRRQHITDQLWCNAAAFEAEDNHGFNALPHVSTTTTQRGGSRECRQVPTITIVRCCPQRVYVFKGLSIHDQCAGCGCRATRRASAGWCWGRASRRTRTMPSSSATTRPCSPST